MADVEVLVTPDVRTPSSDERNVLGSIDTAYFIRGGFLMNAKTLLKVRQIGIYVI
jgi:hypothetical protein